MLEQGDFLDNLYGMLKYPENYSKEQYHEAFLELTERYLNELISNLTTENELNQQLGEEKGSQLIEIMAIANPDFQELFARNKLTDNIQDRIDNLISFAEFQYGIEIGVDPYLGVDLPTDPEDIKEFVAREYPDVDLNDDDFDDEDNEDDKD